MPLVQCNSGFSLQRPELIVNDGYKTPENRSFSSPTTGTMTTSTNSETQADPKAKYWLNPEQVNQMRTATVQKSATYLSARNDTIIATLYDSGLSVDELCQLDVEMLGFKSLSARVR